MFQDGCGFSWRLTCAMKLLCRMTSHLGDFTDLPLFLQTMSMIMFSRKISVPFLCLVPKLLHTQGTLVVVWHQRASFIVMLFFNSSMFSLFFSHLSFHIFVIACILTFITSCSRTLILFLKALRFAVHGLQTFFPVSWFPLLFCLGCW